MSYAPKAYLKLSLADFESEETNGKNEIVCIVFLNDACIDKLYFTNSDYQTNVPLMEPNDKLGLIFQSKETGDILGCVGFQAKMFLPFKGKSFTQWVTLFETPEDDEFDGEIGEHDEELPRTLLNFRVENFPQTSIQGRPTSQSIDEKDQDVRSNQILNDSIKVSPPKQRDQMKTTPSFENIMSEKEINRSLDKSRNSTRITDSPSKSSIRPPVKSPARDQRLEDPNRQDEINIENLEQKISDLITTLQTRSHPEGELYDPTTYDLLIPNKEYEEKRQLLELEVEKSRDLEKALQFAESQLENSEKLYDTLEQTTRQQYQQLLERDRDINQENKDLRDRITELENELIKVKESYSSDLRTHIQKYTKQAEYDKTAIEKYILRIENLEKLNKELLDQLDNSSRSFHQERENNKKHVGNQEDLVKAYKQNLESLKEKNNKYFEQIQTLSDEKISMDRKILELDGKLASYEVRNATLETELEHSNREMERKSKEIDELKSVIQQIKSNIDDVINNKEKEIIALSTELNQAGQTIRKLTADYDQVLNEKDELAQELNSLKSRDYEYHNSNLESALAESEQSRKSLQEALNTADQKIQELIQKGQETVEAYQQAEREKIEETEKKVNELIAQFYELSKQYDDLKFENVDLKLKVDEFSEAKTVADNLREKIDSLKNENNELKEHLQSCRQQLYSTAAELVKQTSIALHQSQIISSMNDQMQTLDESLKTAFGDIKKLHMSLEAAKRIDEYETYSSRKSDEIDQKINEIMNRTRIPIKFIRIGEGVYVFGSRKVHVKIINGKLAIRCGGGYMMLEEFIRLYAHQEISKLKTMKTDQIQYTDMDYEEIHPDARPNQIIRDDVNESVHSIRESEQYRDQFGRGIGRTNSSQKYNEPTRHSSQVYRSEESFYDEDDSKANIIYDITPQSQSSNSKSKKPAQKSKFDHNPELATSSRAIEKELLRTGSIRTTQDTSPYRGGSNRSLKK